MIKAIEKQIERKTERLNQVKKTLSELVVTLKSEYFEATQEQMKLRDEVVASGDLKQLARLDGIIQDSLETLGQEIRMIEERC